MSDALEAKSPGYTYADYLTWDDGKRYELYNGTAYLMSAPSDAHQRISMKLSLLFGNFLEGKPCRVYAAPYDVRLFPEDDGSDDTVVQPDLLVVCDRRKIGSRGCKGAPDMIIEIVSPANTRDEMTRKFNAYLAARVREYWVVDLAHRAVTTHILTHDHGTCEATRLVASQVPRNAPRFAVLSGSCSETEVSEQLYYVSTTYIGPSTAPVATLPGLSISLPALWSALDWPGGSAAR